MPVRYTPPRPEELLPVPGVTLGTAAARIKNWQRDDVLLVVFAPGTAAAGVFTQNRFCAAPVIVCRQHLAAPATRIRALVVNAGNANAGTGAAGIARAEATCAAVAPMLGCAPQQVLPFSTGVIMEPLPVDAIVAGAAGGARRARPRTTGSPPRRAIMTTDTVPKGASRRVVVDGVPVTVTGIAKGAGMIHPEHGDHAGVRGHRRADRRGRCSARLTREIADLSFNCATVDGDTSTNDSFVLSPRGEAPMAPIADDRDPRLAPCATHWRAVAHRARAGDRARRRGRDQVHHHPRRGRPRRRRVPPHCAGHRALAAGQDRVLRVGPESGAHRLRDRQRRRRTSIRRTCRSGSTTCWSSKGAGVPRRIPRRTGQRVMKNDEITVRVALGRGDASATVWTCDFSHDYVSINADYRS